METNGMNRILVTGVAGFIGFHLAKALLDQSYEVIGIDNLCEYYDIQLKRDRLAVLMEREKFYFYGQDLMDEGDLFSVFAEYLPDVVIHMAAQAGVPYSLEDPHCYLQTNIIGFMNVLECCRLLPVTHLLYASSSSVYGKNQTVPYSEEGPAEHPVSIYAATKKANELMAHCYSHLYGIPTTGLRFFTVYGPWGRPDMAYYSYTRDILEGNEISVYNYGEMERDFTYVDDAVEAIIRLIPKAPAGNPEWNEMAGRLSESSAPYKIYNIGNHAPVSLEDFITVLENATGKLAIKAYRPMQAWDVKRTYADVTGLKQATGYAPQTKLSDGLSRFVDWYRSYYDFADQ